MEILNVSDVINFSIRIEEMGELFYRKAALFVTDNETATIFYRLAEEEIRHRDTFKNMLNKLGDHRLPDSYPGEYMRYLRGFIDGKVVFKEGSTEIELANVTDTKSALDFALQKELDSILFYHEIKQLLPESQRKVIDEIITEERKHFETLSEIKKKYA